MASQIEIPEGSAQQQAEYIILHIEARVLYAVQRIRATLRSKLLGSDWQPEAYHFDDMRALFVDPTTKLNIHDFESHLNAFRDLIPEDEHLRAAVAHALLKQYPCNENDAPGLVDLLTISDDAVKQAHFALYGTPINSIYSRYSPEDTRPFWLQMPVTMLTEMMPDLMAELEWVELAAGEVLFEQGDHGDSMYAVIRGRIRIARYDGNQDEILLAERGRGALFGEIMILTGQDAVRTASAYALRETELIKLSADGFKRLALKYPEFGLMITSEIAGNMQRAVSGVYQASQPRSLVFVPASPAVSLNHILIQLEEALSKFGSTVYLNRERFDGEHGSGASLLSAADPRADSLDTWLADLEMAHRFVVLATDANCSEWTQRCLRTADRIFIVANAMDNPEPGPLEIQFRHTQDHRAVLQQELVLIHPSRDSQPNDTKRWYDGRDLARHYHICEGNRKDIERLARLIAGQATGLVLSGGGARGMAHVGVIKAIEESGMPIDVVGGTSFGSIIAAAFGLEWSWQEISEKVQWFTRVRRRYFRLTLPIMGLMDGRQLSRLFHHLYGDVRVEDLWRTCFLVSSNLTQSRMEVLDKGFLWECVRSSIAIPGIFPPVVDQAGDLLLDGGALNNLPSDVMKERLEGGRVIASNTSSLSTREKKFSYSSKTTAWQLMLDRLNPFGNRYHAPTIVEVISETMGLASKWARPQQLVNTDLLIDCPVDSYGLFDYEAIGDLIEIGYRTAMQALESYDNRE